MIIHILFTCNAHKEHSSRCLRGVFTNIEDLENAQQTLKDNGVVEIDGCNEDEYFDIVSIEENEFEEEGGYY